MTTYNPVHDYLRCPTALLALPNATYRICFNRLSCAKRGLFLSKTPVEATAFPLFLRLYKRALSRISPFIHQKVRITAVSLTVRQIGKTTKAPPKYIDGALSYELCLSLRKSGQFSTYLTIVLTASSPSTATATIPAGTAIVALSEVRTVSATTLPKMLVITTDLPAAP